MALTDIRNFQAIDERLGTAGQPTEAQLGDVAADGYAAVVNLGLLDPKYCLPDEAASVASLGLGYRHIPVKFDAPTVEDFRTFVATMDEWEDKKVFVHCAANYRVSTFVALYGELRLGWTRERAEALIRELWQPNDTWRAFIARCREESVGELSGGRLTWPPILHSPSDPAGSSRRRSRVLSSDADHQRTVMPSVLIEVRQAYPREKEVAIIEAVHAALREAFKILPADRNVRLVVHEPHRFACPPDRQRPEAYTHISIDAFAGRSLEAKRNLYLGIVANLEPLGIPKDHVKILLREIPREDWGIRGGQAASDVELGFKIDV